MNRRAFIELLGAGITLAPTKSIKNVVSQQRPDQTGSVSPFDVGSKVQLFVDGLLVRKAERVSFNLHQAQKHPGNPLLKADRDWEGWWVQLYGNVLVDKTERVFKMWYLAEGSRCFPSCATLYAASTDGIYWEKPNVGTVACTGHKRHNAVLDGCHLASVIQDNQDSDPSLRYKMICWRQTEPRGYHTFISPDGLQWRQLSTTPIHPGGDVITGYYDEKRKLYVAFAKRSTVFRNLKRRSFDLITSDDFERWSEPKLAWLSDLQDDVGSLRRIEEVRSLLDVPDNPTKMRTEFYGIGVYPHESCTLAFPWIFTINNNDRYASQEGPMEVQLASSRDLEHWDRKFRIPCVPLGEVGEWDCGMIRTQSRALRVGDEVWLYYGGFNFTHGHPVLYEPKHPGRGTKFTASIGLAKWELDRFVSADGRAEGGTLTTVPIVFSGDRLEINARTRRDGVIQVEILDAAGRKIEETGISDPISGDELRQTVTWRGQPKVGFFKKRSISLRFHLKSAELYSFAFRTKS